VGDQASKQPNLGQKGTKVGGDGTREGVGKGIDTGIRLAQDTKKAARQKGAARGMGAKKKKKTKRTSCCGNASGGSSGGVSCVEVKMLLPGKIFRKNKLGRKGRGGGEKGLRED